MLRKKIALAMMKKLMEKTLPALRRSAVKIETAEELPDNPGASRLGGIPDVPADFQWPYFTTDTYDDDTVKPRPLAFLAQFSCEELTALDPEHPLPKKGVLSFSGGDSVPKMRDVPGCTGLRMQDPSARPNTRRIWRRNTVFPPGASSFPRKSAIPAVRT